MPAKLLKSIKVPAQLTRAAAIEIEGEGETKALRISISSDVPYKRFDWWNNEEYYEVLSHAAGDCDETRIKAGLPLLYNHDRNAHVGRAASYENDGKKITVFDIIESESVFAKEKWADARNGSLPDTSVGYEITGEGKCIGEKDGLPIYSFPWRCNEASLVTVPADITVGVERGHKPDGEPKEISIKGIDGQGKKTNKTKSMKPSFKGGIGIFHRDSQVFRDKADDNSGGDDNEDLTEEEKKSLRAKGENSGIALERARVKKITDYQNTFPVAAMKEKVAEMGRTAIEEGKSFEEFRDMVLTGWEGIRAVETTSPEVGLSRKEAKSFSILAAARQIASGGALEGLEKEACDAARKHYKIKPSTKGAFILPQEVVDYNLAGSRDFSAELFNLLARTHGQRTGQAVSPATAGGFTVETTLGPLIEILRNRTVLGALGITELSGLVGDLALPVQTGGATAYWVSETGTLTDAMATFGQKALTPHRLGATIPFSTQFIAQSSISAEAFVRNELMIACGIELDRAGLLGTGLSGEPLGVAFSSGINQTVTYSGGATWADVVEHETGIAVDNADIGAMAFLLSAATVGKWKTILRDSVAGAQYLIGDNGLVNGYPYQRTNQISSTSQSFFGVWSQLIRATWAGVEIIVDPFTLATSGQVRMTMNQFADYLCRQPLAFNVSTDSAAQ